MSKSDPGNGALTRAEVATIVDAVVREGHSLDAALAVAEERVAESEHSLLRMLSYGVLRFHWRLSAQVDALLSRPLRRRDQIIHTLLIVGIFQLTDSRIAPHATVSLTVESAKRLNRPKLAPLVNAVLRNFIRQKSVDPGSDEALHNHPSWMLQVLQDDWPDHWKSIVEANNRQAPMWLRVNARRSTAADYLQRLDGRGREQPGIEQAIRLDQPLPVDDLPGFRDGEVSVQDAAAQLAAPWLAAERPRRVLDLCSAPGGKTAHLLELLQSDAVLTAVEADRKRTELIRETLDRLSLQATIHVADASKPEDWWDSEPFDRVLLDAPCSASGVIRRHPDIKHLRRRGDLADLSRLQSQLLDSAWRVLAPGGRLLYVTCSVFRDENDRNIAAFLGRHDDAAEKHLLPNNNIRALMIAAEHGFQILPGTEDLDGFYYACMEKHA